MPLFLRPASVIGKRRDSVMSHSCQRRMAQDPDRRVAEVADAAVGLRHPERRQIEVRPIRERHVRIAGVADEERLARQLAARVRRAVAIGERRVGVLRRPALFELQVGVIAWPLSSFVTPEICQLLSSCLSTGAS